MVLHLRTDWWGPSTIDERLATKQCLAAAWLHQVHWIADGCCVCLGLKLRADRATNRWFKDVIVFDVCQNSGLHVLTCSSCSHTMDGFALVNWQSTEMTLTIFKATTVLFFPTSLWGFCFLACIPPVSRPPRLPVRRASVINSFHTQLVSHTTHLTHNSSHTQTSKNLSHTTHLTQLILHTTHLTHNSSHKSSHLTHNSSHTTHLTQLISHTTHLTHNSSHTTHLTQRISHNSSHSTNSYHSSHTSGRGYLLRGRCSTQSLLKELRRGLSPAGPRLLFAWQTQYTEPPEGAAARIVAGWAAAPLCVADAVHRASWRSCGADCRRLGRGYLLRGRCSTQSLLLELRRGLSPAGPRLLFTWQTQYKEPREGAAARIVAGWAAAPLCVADTVHRASWRSCGADCRRLGHGSSLRGRRSTQSPEKPAARIVAGWAAASLCVADAVHRASWRSCGADCRRLGRGFSLCGARYTEPPEGAAARILAGWAAAALHSALPHHSLHTTDLTPPIAQHSSRNQSAHTTHLSPVSYPSPHSTHHTTAYLTTTDLNLTPLIL